MYTPARLSSSLFLLLLLHLLAIQPVFGQMYDYGLSVQQRLPRRLLQPRDNDATPYVVGQLGSNGSHIPARQEVRQLEKDDPDLWTLYLLGLNMMQYTDQSMLLSYYQIAGIHGVPWTEWNGVAPTPGNENTGYCMHASTLFLTWHRPYLALYEQILYSLVQHIASLYPDNSTRARYQSAATQFRIPYMDWAARPPAGESVLPSSVGASEVISIDGPNGVQDIANPLFTYRFNPLNATIFLQSPYNQWPETLRAPTAGDASAQSNNTLVALALNQNFLSVQQRLYNLFSSYDSYANFSNEAWIPPSQNGKYDSLESLHDTIHSLLGLQGHMSWIPFSAFDPVFFLHHAMVDRALALWQVLYPDSWVAPAVAATNSFTSSKGQLQDAQTALTPFYASTNGTFWTSDSVRDLGVFGYTYDDMADIPPSSLTTANATAQAAVKSLINRLYGQSSPATLLAAQQEADKKHIRRSRGGWTEGPWPASYPRPPSPRDKHKKSQPWSSGEPEPPSLPSPLSPSVLVNRSRYWDWIVNIRANRQALDGSFFVHMFLGDPPADQAVWAIAKNLVGTMSAFASPASAMAGMAGMGGMDYDGARGARPVLGLASGTVPLTLALARLVSRHEVASLTPADVEPYLQQHLQYRIVTATGRVVAAKDVPGLAIAVASAEVQVPSRMQDFPRRGESVIQFILV